MAKKNKKNVEVEEEKVEAKSGRKVHHLFNKRNIFIGVVAILFLIQFIQMQRAFGTFSFLEGRDSSLITEIGEMRESYLKIGNDLNEVRNFLRMPTNNYQGVDAMEGENGDKNEDNLQLALFKYVDFLSTSREIQANNEKYREYLQGLVDSEEFKSFLEGQGLVLSALNENESGITLVVRSVENDDLVNLYLDKANGKLYRASADEKTEIEDSNDEFAKNLESFLKENKEQLVQKFKDLRAKKEFIASLISAEETQKVASDLGVSISSEASPVEDALEYSIENSTGDVIGVISLDTEDGDIALLDTKNEDIKVTLADDGKGFVPFLKKLDTRTFIQKKVEDAHHSVKETINDKGFKLLLSEHGFSMKGPEEDDQRIYYYLNGADGAAVAAIIIEKTTGVVNIANPDGTSSENILFFDPNFKKKTLKLPDEIPDYGQEISSSSDTFNILVSGKHGSLVDTMIVVHIDEKKREMRMVSIPRDLFYNGRKINAYGHYYGMPELKRVLSEISGYQIDKYILIDMYAFIDVIDLIGGIDIHLDKAVIDPTYKTIDNGVTGTLHYEPGDYHLGGKEALRLARSRYTSSDFARAERQQKILQALQDKARNFGFGDADTIYEMARAVLAKTETDISLDEALAYYFRYQNYEITSNAVMTSGNVLYVPPYITAANCRAMIAAAEAAEQPRPGCENENQAYTLYPRDNNWNIIKWFFRQEFEGV